MHKGFTLIELLVVIAIIGILAAVVITGLASQRTRAYEASAFMSMKSVQTQAALCVEDHYDPIAPYPTDHTPVLLCTGVQPWPWPLPSGWVYDNSSACTSDLATADGAVTWCARNSVTSRFIKCTLTECEVGSY